MFRHENSASVVKGFVGQQPKTAWVIDYSLLERIHYLLVAGFEGAMSSRRPTAERREVVRGRLVRLYEAMARPSEARKYRDFALPTFSDR